MNATSNNKLKRSVKIYFLLILATLFCVSLTFGLIHHFFRYDWAGDIFYGTALVFVAVLVVEIFLITFTK